MNDIMLNKYNGKEIDIADELTRYYLSIKDKRVQALWMSNFLVQSGHDRQNISFEFESLANSEYMFYFADNKKFNNAFIVKTKEKYLDNVGIFIPGKTYFWKVLDLVNNIESEVDSFKILNAPCRWISSGTVFNMRDLGGWSTIDNKRLKYGLIYRGGQLSLDNQWEKSYMDDYSYKVFDYLQIKTEVELRGGYSHEVSFIHDYTNMINIDGIGYELIFKMTEKQKEEYRILFKVLSKKESYPIYFHCSWGADRTGVLAFLISGVLGVPYDNLCEDYELTSLSGSGRRTRIDFPWKDMYPELIKEYGDGKTFKDIINEYLIRYVGVKQEEIDSLRKIMLENKQNNTKTHTVKYMINDNIYLESKVFDGQYISSVEPGLYIDKCLKYWINGNEIYNFNTPVFNDLTLNVKLEDILSEDYDSISLNDLGLGEMYDLKEAKDYKYNKKVTTGSRIFSFDYKIESKDNIFDDGVHVEIGNLWDYKAHVWFQNLNFLHVYNRKDMLSISYQSKFEYSKIYRIEIGVLIPKNGRNKGKKMLVLKIDNRLITMLETSVDLNINSIGLAGTKGILYNVSK